MNMRLPKVEVERREKAIVEWFKKNPQSTGEAMNKALAAGQLTGKKEPQLNIKTVYELRKKARAELVAAEKPPTLPADAFKSARRFPESAGLAVAVEGPTLTEQARKHIQGLLGEFKYLSEDILDLTVRRNGTIGVGRMVRREEQLASSETQKK